MPASFMAAPVFDSVGATIGVFAVHIPLDGISALLQGREGGADRSRLPDRAGRSAQKRARLNAAKRHPGNGSSTDGRSESGEECHSMTCRASYRPGHSNSEAPVRRSLPNRIRPNCSRPSSRCVPSS